ncbi:similar to associated molecule with the SH3 domain of STAM (predicted), partial [Rattus norvegicus]
MEILLRAGFLSGLPFLLLNLEHHYHQKNLCHIHYQKEPSFHHQHLQEKKPMMKQPQEHQHLPGRLQKLSSRKGQVGEGYQVMIILIPDQEVGPDYCFAENEEEFFHPRRTGPPYIRVDS